MHRRFCFLAIAKLMLFDILQFMSMTKRLFTPLQTGGTASLAVGDLCIMCII